MQGFIKISPEGCTVECSCGGRVKVTRDLYGAGHTHLEAKCLNCGAGASEEIA